MCKGLVIYFDIDTGYYPGLHHGLAYLMGSVKKDNDIQFFHVFKEDHLLEIKEIIENNNWDFIGVSFTTNQRKFLWKLFEIANCNQSLLIGGGVHPTLDKENTFKEFPQLDAICIGEGEMALLELCERIDNNKNVTEASSFMFKTKDSNGKTIIKVNPTLELQHIDDLAPADYTVFDYKRIISDSGNVFPMMLGRGCPYKCTYCASAVLSKNYPNPQNWVRFPSIDRSIRIIKNNLELYPDTRSVIFADDTFTVRKDWISEFCEKYKKEINLPFECNARVETINDRVCEDLKSAGCQSVDFGVESGSEWLRNNVVNRKHKNQVIIKAFDTVKKHGIKGFSYNIVGMPFETPKMMRQTYELNRHQLKAARYGRAFYYYPYPGTGMHDVSLKYKLLRPGIEQLTGYLEAPTVIEQHATHKEIRKWFKKINLLFAVRLICDRFRLPVFISEVLVSVTQVFWMPLAEIVEPDKSNIFMKKINSKLKSWVKKLKNPGHAIYNSHDVRKVEEF
jgi:anaerobic magnesium-protoporphyrin IX monomethyl ester cyclase